MDPDKPSACMSDANQRMMCAYPEADTEKEVNDTLFFGAPRILPDSAPDRTVRMM